MAIIKIGEQGDGEGAFEQYDGGDPPTFGDSVTLGDRDYRVVDVERFISAKRSDVIQVDVTER